MAEEQGPPQEHSPACEYSRDSTFYFDDVVFLVEDTLFKVPRAHFVNGSPFFHDMFTLPPPAGTPVDGSSDVQPLHLDGISKIEFTYLLRALFPRQHAHRENTSIPEWTGVLKLATMWQFERIRGYAIKRLGRLRTLGPVQRLVLATMYHIPGWYVPAIIALAQRDVPLSVEEALMIGVATALKIAEVRGSYPNRDVLAPLAAFGLRSSTRISYNFRPKIEEVFGPKPELNAM